MDTKRHSAPSRSRTLNSSGPRRPPSQRFGRPEVGGQDDQAVSLVMKESTPSWLAWIRFLVGKLTESVAPTT